MKKIAIIATYLGKVDRGAETFVIELAKRLKDNYEVTIFSTGIHEEFVDNTIKVSIEKGFLLKVHEKLYYNNRIYRRLVGRYYSMIPEVLYQKKFTKKVFEEHINNKQYDLLYPNNGVWGARYSRLYREKNNTPYIYTGHGGIGEGERLIINEKPDCYVCLNEEHLLWAKRYSSKVIAIHNGVETKKFYEGEKDKSVKKVISVGALTDFKRHHLSIEAISKLKNVELLLLGKGELESSLRGLGEKVLGNRFTLKSVPYNEIPLYYSNSDLFLLPSKDEPFGIVYLEAMAANLPVVAPNDSVRKEIIGNCGLYCDCENIDAYAKTIEKALQIDWGNRPKERAKKFDWNIISNLYIDLINSKIR